MDMDLLKHLGWRKHDQRLLCDLGGATRIGSSVEGGHKRGGAGTWFYLSLLLCNLKSSWWIQLQLSYV